MFAVSRLNGLSFTLMSVTVHGVKTGFPSGNTPCFLRASRGIREIKIHVYGILQTANVS